MPFEFILPFIQGAADAAALATDSDSTAAPAQVQIPDAPAEGVSAPQPQLRDFLARFGNATAQEAAPAHLFLQREDRKAALAVAIEPLIEEHAPGSALNARAYVELFIQKWGRDNSDYERGNGPSPPAEALKKLNRRLELAKNALNSPNPGPVQRQHLSLMDHLLQNQGKGRNP
jgi:hypothetical protein